MQWPWDVQLREWKVILRRVAHEVSDDNVSMVAAALSFYAMLALFPGMIALISIYGLIADRGQVSAAIGQLSSILPSDAWKPLETQLHALVSTESTSLSLGLLVSTLAALWSASSGVDALITATNAAYHKDEKRSWVKRRGVSLLFTVALVLFMGVAISLIAVVPSLLALLGERFFLLRLIDIARWPTLGVFVALGLMVLYRYAPCRPTPRRWASSGAILGAAVWLTASAGFSMYVSNFGNYNETYGALGGVIALLLWFYISAFIVLVGAEISAELEGEKTDANVSEQATPREVLA